jgi:hypothetical protein
MPRKKKRNAYQEELEKLALEAYQDARKKRLEALELEERARRMREVARNSEPKKRIIGGPVFQRTISKVVLLLPFRRALMKRQMMVPDWARRQRNPPVSVETVKNWLKPARKRPIPEFWAKKIEAEFRDEHGRSEVPAVDSSWPHGIFRG